MTALLVPTMMSPAPAETCSHQDASRSTVSVTAHGVAYMRGLETKLYHDPYASLLAGEVGRVWSDYQLASNANCNLISQVIVRTKKIDDSLTKLLANPLLRQVCCLGAGLDTRPWRLTPPPTPEGVPVRYYEVDFPEIFSYKLPMLAAAGAVPAFSYRAVSADLSLSSWPAALLMAGYDPALPTVWLLEGVTGYLSEAENRSLFTRLASLSAAGSCLLATFLTPASGSSVGVQLHRFMPSDPLALLKESGGWTGAAEDLLDCAEGYGRGGGGGGCAEEKRQDLRGYLLANVSV